MNTKTAVVVATLALSAIADTAGAKLPVDPQTASGWFANRIVGAYGSEAQVKVCGTPGQGETVKNTIIFNQGGTVVASPRFPPRAPTTTRAPTTSAPGLTTRARTTIRSSCATTTS